MKRKSVYCPKCGERWETRVYESTGKGTRGRQGWKDFKPDEIVVLKRCLSGELAPHQAALLLGRNANSIRIKLHRMRNGTPAPSENTWKDSEVAVLQKAIREETHLREVAAQLNRTYDSVRQKARRMKG
ncbi:hypothetical protein ACFFJY_09210 [Fictibacillus aquaticus]|uniref:hypothetical protein n=1 Tax=Fictibacillus aquaticus TaxID=2021314 RepID=UPI001054F4DA|nr:hypothetical protein [Fictibacillus aquaticus]